MIIFLSPETVERIRSNHYQQPINGLCVICNTRWKECPHKKSKVMEAIKIIEEKDTPRDAKE